MRHQSPSKWVMGVLAVGLVNCGGRSALDSGQRVVGTGPVSGAGTGGTYASSTKGSLPIATGGTSLQPGTTSASTGGAPGYATAGGTSSATGGRPTMDDCGAIGSSPATLSLIDDMENGSGRILNTDGRVGAWYAFDGSGGSNQWPAPTSPGVPIETSEIPNGRCASTRAMHTYGDLYLWGGIGLDLNFDGTTYGTYNASAYSGITFWAHGSSENLEVRIGTAPSTSTHYGGTCTLDDPPSSEQAGNEGCQSPSSTIYLGDDFVQYWVPFAALSPPAGTSSDVFDATVLTNIQFYNNFELSDTGHVDYWIDDVYFYSGVPSCCAASPPECSGTIQFSNVNLRQAISAKDVSCADVCYLNILSYAPGNFQTLEGLQCLVSLKQLILNTGSLNDISSIANLTELYRLELPKHQVSNLAPISNLFRLKYLNVSSNGLVNLEPLAGLTRLATLDLSTNSINNIAALAELKDLTNLALNNNQIGNLEPLSGLTALATLKLSNNSISSAASLSTLTALTSIDLSHNALVNTEGLSTQTQLTSLNLSDNQLADVSNLGALIQLTTLDLSNNQVTDPRPLSNLPNLVSINLTNNRVCDLANFGNLPKLTTLDLSNNQISNLRDLLPMNGLTSLNLSNNLLNDNSDLSGLTQVNSLWTLNLSGNQMGVVGDLSPLTHVATLDLSNNAIYDISNLAALPALYSVNLSDNRISNVSSLGNGNRLGDLNLKGNQIAELGQFLTLSWNPPGNYGAMATLDVSNNPIDCTAQAANIKALRAIPIQLTITCP